MLPVGELAALLTSVLWALSAVGFSNATRELGAQVTNRLRVGLAFGALLLINTVLYAQPIPVAAGWGRWGWLTLSGFLGLALGDAFLFSCYRELGPRLGLLLLSLAPVFGAGLAWGLFGETLTLGQSVGILITLGGIAWVVAARREGAGAQAGDGRRGVLFGLLAALCQAAGLVLSKQAMGDNFPPFAATLIRLLAAVGSLWLGALVQRQVGATVQQVRTHPVGLRWAIFGAFFGPVLGVSASLFAVQQAEVGVASALMALPPVVMLPISHFFYKEKLTGSAIVGTLVAIGGVVVLLLK